MDHAHVPAEPGFRRRGGNVTRLETFVDAAFAFSLTLLVISYNELPGSVMEMREALRRVPTFVACFALIAMFWAGHNRWSRRFGLEDTRSTVLSLAFVLVVLVYVYPLRMVISAGLSVLSGGWVPNELGGFGGDWLLDLQTLFVTYSAGFGLLSLLLWLLNRHARANASALRLDAFERFQLDSELGLQAIGALTALVSTLTSLVVLAFDWREGLAVSLPMWAYALMGVVIPVYFQRRDRRLAREGLAA